MKYLVKINNLKDISNLKDYVSGFIIGNTKVSSMINHSFSLNNIIIAINKANEYGKEIYFLMNKMVFENEIKYIEMMFDFLKDKKLTGIIISDISLLQLARKYNLETKIVYNPNTLITNHIDFNYLHKYKIRGAFISNGVTLDTINQINQKKEMFSFYTGFGYINIFYSKRNLISLYYDFKKIDDKVKTKNKAKYFIKEETRNDFFHIYEDSSGTYIFRPNIYNATPYIKEIIDLDYFVFDNIFISSKEMEEFLIEFKNNSLINNPKFKYNNGFLNKKIGYRK